MKRLISVIALGASLSAFAESPNITGTWNMGLQGDHVIPTAFVLKQEGKVLTGTIAMPTQRNGQRLEIQLSGSITDGAFSLSGTVDGADASIEVAGKLNDDGSLEGTVKSHHGTMPWTAERLKERK
jgi:hypothetical protein